MSAPFPVALFEQPGITARRIGDNFPSIVVKVAEEETVRVMLQRRFRNFGASPRFLLHFDNFIGGVYFFLGLNVESVRVEQRHDLFWDLHYGNGVIAAEANEQRYISGADHLKVQNPP